MALEFKPFIFENTTDAWCDLHMVLLFVFVFNGANHSLIALKIEKMCFREQSILYVFDFKQCDDLSYNIIFPYADQNILWRRVFWPLRLSYLQFNLPQRQAMILTFVDIVF